MIIPFLPKEHKIPTWLALSILALVVMGSVWLIQKKSFPLTQASTETTPSQIEITNVGETSFTVSWITQEPTTGLIKYGEDNQPTLIIRDKRDPLTGNFGAYATHWVKISGLNPGSSYAFVIESNGQTFDNNGSPYQITTAPQMANNPTQPQQIINSTVVTADRQPASGAIAYLRSSNMSPQSVLINQVGEWSINLSEARTENLDQFFVYGPEQTFQLFIQGGHLPSSTITFTGAYPPPLPEITLGQNYNFPSSPDSLSLGPHSESSPRFHFDFTPLTGFSTSTTPEDITIWNPEQDEPLATQLPLFLGRGPISTELTLTITAETPIVDTVGTDEQGNWQWSPADSLSPGSHTLTVSYLDSQNINHQTSRNFVILTGNGGLPAFEASPPATLSPFPSLSISPTPTIIFEISPAPSRVPIGTSPTLTAVSLTPRPTSTLTPTSTATRTPTPTPTGQLLAPTSTPTPAIPVSGFALPTIGLAGIGLVLIGFGIILVI